ncbi:sigma-70 family RNA polymerase sigma factor [Micromonospora polyrhachis]|uniref:RNA polymerase sigma-70 factor (ECF subfamily) n=1 Tax=Micromonospora polyrhachis TaxID=1282883 RepID=A0A7W7WQY4_9ACTN|nr:RNA polymerase sigma factor SigJ [Micromonospora polyrhachis]MBB4959987.1 RNA polymerase sigma-70 factor (ECF subfamily) [Micromonospora polyrhachis]
MELTSEFEQHRPYLMAVAYRMLGSRTEAEDVVQEAWLRYQAADRDGIQELRGWLTTVTGRLCLDTLRSARVRREAYVGPWLPEPIVSRLPTGPEQGEAVDPADRAVRRDEVSYALLVVMERLTPEQRVAFVLHDVFAVPFPEIASLLGSTDVAVRQLASRARRVVAAEDGSARHRPDPAEQRRVVDAFVRAVEAGDLDALLGVLAPTVTATGDGGGVVNAGRRSIVGAEKVARFLLGILRRAVDESGTLLVEPILVNGDLGLLVDLTRPQGPALRFSMAFAFDESGRIAHIYDQLNPAKLTGLPPRLTPGLPAQLSSAEQPR